MTWPYAVQADPGGGPDRFAKGTDPRHRRHRRCVCPDPDGRRRRERHRRPRVAIRCGAEAAGHLTRRTVDHACHQDDAAYSAASPPTTGSFVLASASRPSGRSPSPPATSTTRPMRTPSISAGSRHWTSRPAPRRPVPTRGRRYRHGVLHRGWRPRRPAASWRSALTAMGSPD